jgi:GntR family transcriptional regulator, transcriptional repressor for pyruvate dehydrogenase complex
MVSPMNEIFKPIKQIKISEEIADQLKSLIFEGKLKPGEKLPSERDLAKSLNVSRVSLREALNTLQGMGLLEIQHGNRTFIRPMTTRSILDPLVSFSKEYPDNTLKLLEIRRYLELGSVFLAAERATKDEVKQLEKILKKMEEDLKKNHLGAKADIEFHFLIANATHNEAYIHIMQTIYDLLEAEFRIAWGEIFRENEKRKILFEQHKSIFEAIRDRNPKKGADEANRHHDFLQKEWKEALIK